MSNHKLNIEMLEMDRHCGKSDVYRHLYDKLHTLINLRGERFEDAFFAQWDFERAEYDSLDSTQELLNILDEYDLKDEIVRLKKSEKMPDNFEANLF